MPACLSALLPHYAFRDRGGERGRERERGKYRSAAGCSASCTDQGLASCLPGWPSGWLVGELSPDCLLAVWRVSSDACFRCTEGKREREREREREKERERERGLILWLVAHTVDWLAGGDDLVLPAWLGRLTPPLCAPCAPSSWNRAHGRSSSWEPRRTERERERERDVAEERGRERQRVREGEERNEAGVALTASPWLATWLFAWPFACVCACLHSCPIRCRRAYLLSCLPMPPETGGRERERKI